MPIFNAHVSTARNTLMMRSGRCFRPGRGFRAVRSKRASVAGPARGVAGESGQSRRLSGRPTSPRQGVVDAVKLTGLQKAVLTIWREN